MNIYKFLIKDANWHALPIDEYLQNFQLKMLIKDFKLKFLKLIKNKRPFVQDILCVSRTIQYLQRFLKTKDLCVANNTILTRMLNTKDPLYREKYNIYIDA